MNRRELMLGLSGLGLAGLAGPAFAQGSAAARDAWIYGLPLIEMATTRARHLKAGARLNAFNGGRALADHTARQVTTPNNDTLYLSAWVDLTRECATLTVPVMGDRYWSVAVMDMYTNNNAVLGSRTVGSQGGTFVLAAPGYVAPIIDNGMEPYVVRVATPYAWVLARVLVDGPEDVANVQQLLKGFKIEGVVGDAPPILEGSRGDAAAAYFEHVRALMVENPAPATDLGLVRRCATLLSPTAPPAMASPDLDAGVAEARKLIGGGFGRDKPVNGWSYPRANLGDFGQDYTYRAAVALGGLGALPQAEAVYLRPVGEKDGLFHSDKLYRLSLPAQVPVDGFWSLSMYEATADGQYFFTDNPLKRYAIGDRTKGLKRNAEGGLDLWLGRADPGGARSANWLPAPKAGPWMVTWRGYLPRPELLGGAWRMPAIVPA
ncbi:MAG: phosphatidylserine decarboxylase [Caulobacter sp.]|nr:phosphatidylserine decarboxylase [Caulobacter sp.]